MVVLCACRISHTTSWSARYVPLIAQVDSVATGEVQHQKLMLILKRVPLDDAGIRLPSPRLRPHLPHSHVKINLADWRDWLLTFVLSFLCFRKCAFPLSPSQNWRWTQVTASSFLWLHVIAHYLTFETVKVSLVTSWIGKDAHRSCVLGWISVVAMFLAWHRLLTSHY